MRKLDPMKGMRMRDEGDALLTSSQDATVSGLKNLYTSIDEKAAEASGRKS